MAWTQNPVADGAGGTRRHPVHGGQRTSRHERVQHSHSRSFCSWPGSRSPMADSSFPVRDLSKAVLVRDARFASPSRDSSTNVEAVPPIRKRARSNSTTATNLRSPSGRFSHKRRDFGAGPQMRSNRLHNAANFSAKIAKGNCKAFACGVRRSALSIFVFPKLVNFALLKLQFQPNSVIRPARGFNTPANQTHQIRVHFRKRGISWPVRQPASTIDPSRNFSRSVILKPGTLRSTVSSQANPCTRFHRVSGCADGFGGPLPASRTALGTACTSAFSPAIAIPSRPSVYSH